MNIQSWCQVKRLKDIQIYPLQALAFPGRKFWHSVASKLGRHETPSSSDVECYLLLHVCSASVKLSPASDTWKEIFLGVNALFRERFAHTKYFHDKHNKNILLLGCWEIYGCEVLIVTSSVWRRGITNLFMLHFSYSSRAYESTAHTC